MAVGDQNIDDGLVAIQDAVLRNWRVGSDFALKFAEAVVAFQRFVAEACDGSEESVEHRRFVEERRNHVRSALLQSGWFVGLSLPLDTLDRLFDSVVNERWSEVEAVVVSFARSMVAHVHEKVGRRWIHRRSVLEDAIEAHRQGKYTLSVPVLLTQIDGVSNEYLKSPMFNWKNKAPVTRPQAERLLAATPEWLRQSLMAGPVIPAVFDPLISGSAMGATREQWNDVRSSRPGIPMLNRHRVLHGQDVNYGCEENSLRCLMVLDYLHDVEQFLTEVGVTDGE